MVSLAKNPFRMMAGMLLKAQKYMNVEDTLAAMEGEGKKGVRPKRMKNGTDRLSEY